jgi:hypothetical protein
VHIFHGEDVCDACSGADTQNVETFIDLRVGATTTEAGGDSALGFGEVRRAEFEAMVSRMDPVESSVLAVPDSPPHTPQSLLDFAARGFVRVNRYRAMHRRAQRAESAVSRLTRAVVGVPFGHNQLVQAASAIRSVKVPGDDGWERDFVLGQAPRPPEFNVPHWERALWSVAIGVTALGEWAQAQAQEPSLLTFELEQETDAARLLAGMRHDSAIVREGAVCGAAVAGDGCGTCGTE